MTRPITIRSMPSRMARTVTAISGQISRIAPMTIDTIPPEISSERVSRT
jgi:hypothetical protein